MLRSLNSAIGGLKNHQVFMDVVGNNIANVNTTGFKASRVTFSTMLSQTLRAASAPQNGQGGLNAEQVGLGMATSSIDVLNTQGTMSTTGKLTDLSVQGDGYFIQTDGLRKFYTRDGALDLGADATLISPATGMHVMGWMADNTGKLNNATPPTSPITIPIGQAVTAKPSSLISFNGNLNGAPTNMVNSGIAEVATGTDSTIAFSIAATDAVTFTYNGTTYTTGTTSLTAAVTGTTTLTAVAANLQAAMNSAISTATGVLGDIQVNVSNSASLQGEATFTFIGSKALSFGNSASANSSLNSILKARSMKGLESMNGSMTVYDSLGNAHNLTLKFQKLTSDQTGTSQLDLWQWSVTNLDGGTTINSATAGNGTGTGYIQFDSAGKLASVSTSSTVAGTLAKTSQAGVTFNYSNGAAAQSVNLDFTSLTELQDGDTVAAAANDGFATGTLQAFTVGQDGTITGSYSNGVSQVLGQIALATFANPGGLNHVGQNLYVESANSGLANIGTAMTSSRGQINSGQLEMSNVDLAQQFTDMIRAERGFQANSRIITTSDEMLQDLVNLKR